MDEVVNVLSAVDLACNDESELCLPAMGAEAPPRYLLLDPASWRNEEVVGEATGSRERSSSSSVDPARREETCDRRAGIIRRRVVR